MSTQTETTTFCVCDRCGERVLPSWKCIKGFAFDARQMTTPGSEGPSLSNGDLCPKCTESFLKWLQNPLGRIALPERSTLFGTTIKLTDVCGHLQDRKTVAVNTGLRTAACPVCGSEYPITALIDLGIPNGGPNFSQGG